MLHSKNANITTTDLTTIFEIPQGFVGYLSYVYLKNKGSALNNCTLYIENTSDSNSIHLLSSQDIDPDQSVEFHEGVFVMYENDTVKCQTTSAGDVDVSCTFDIIEATAVLANFNRL